MKFEHQAPVLDACWGEEEKAIFSGGLDWQVKLYVLLSPLKIEFVGDQLR